MALYGPRFTHSELYYQRVLYTLIEGLKQQLTDPKIATLLNDKGLLSPGGQRWTTQAVKNALHKLRHHQEKPSRLHHMLLLLCFNGRMSPAGAEILFRPRIQTGM